MPVDYSIKPPLGSDVDWSHPIARSLAGCWLFNERAGAPQDVTRFNGSGNYTEQAWADGGFKQTSLSIAARSSISKHKFAGDFTAFVIFKPTIKSGNSNTVLFGAHWGGSDPSKNEWTINGNYYSTADFKLHGRIATGSTQYIAGGSRVWGLGETLALGLVKRGSDLLFWDNKTKSSTSCSASAINALDDKTIALGNFSNNETAHEYNSVGIYKFAGIWDRALSDDEVKSLIDNPFQFIRTPSKRIWLFARSGTSLTPISLTLRAMSSASSRSGVLHGGLIAGRSNTVSRLLSTPIAGHLLNAKSSSASTTQAQPMRAAALAGKADSASTVKAQAIKSAKLAGQVESESSETANITKSVPLASITGRTATASSQSMGVIGGHGIAAKTSTATNALAYVRIILPSISAGDCEFEISYDVSGLAVSPESATLTATEEGTVLTLEVSKMKTGDTLGYVNMTLTRNGSAFNPSGYSLTVIGKVGTRIMVRKQPEIVDASTGRIRFRFEASEINTPGTMQFEVYAKDTSTTPNRVLTIGSTGYPSITIEPALGVPL